MLSTTDEAITGDEAIKDLMRENANTDESRQSSAQHLNLDPGRTKGLKICRRRPTRSANEITGVGFYRNYWRSTWQINGEPGALHFSLKQYGEAAKELAILARMEAISSKKSPSREQVFELYKLSRPVIPSMKLVIISVKI